MGSFAQKVWHHSLIRFLLVGVLNTIVGLSATYLLLNLAGLSYWAATFAGNCIGAVVSYFLNKTFTFRDNQGIGKSWWRFVVVMLASYVLAYSIGLQAAHWVLLRFTDDPRWLENAAVLVGAGLYTIANYVGHKFFTFR
ncbi:GtrA family protein [Tumebacillus permanentifrigoris]|uniref:Putative flippase GtrA n=1 Tax=Tumebacillus permanentifrigoris TaxID=378543 RepID=A0A316D5L3_9BACL|nr:GtrA family protein [Tumebacillus permanentifrigoris]PWK07002.1 putative flippase GtrA [Tumebacillus permanentifrigoris]